MSRQGDLFDYDLYGGDPPSQKHSRTSRKAAKRIRKALGPLHRKVLDYLKANPQGATDEQMQDEIPMEANTQRPRRRELELMGYVLDSNRTKLTRASREAVIWVLAWKGKT